MSVSTALVVRSAVLPDGMEGGECKRRYAESAGVCVSSEGDKCMRGARVGDMSVVRPSNDARGPLMVDEMPLPGRAGKAGGCEMETERGV